MLLLVGCGRFGFGEQSPGDGGFTGGVIDAPDGALPLVDVAPLDAMLPSGLVVWFPLDEINPQNASDVVSGFGATCIGATCPVMTGGHRNSAFLFDGEDDCITVPDMGQFGQARLTLSLWMRQDTNDACSPFAKVVNTTSTSNTWQIETTVTNQLSFTTTHSGDSNSRITTANNAFVIGQWQHVAMTYDGTTKQIYVDGAPIVSGGQASALLYNTQSAYIGCDNNGGSPAMRFSGAIDEVQIYNRALTSPEIQTLAAM